MKQRNLLLVVLLLLAGSIGFSQVLGRIEYMEGTVQISRNGTTLSGVDIGTSIENLDQVKTTPDSSVTIAFSKNSGLSGTLQIVPGTTAVIRQDQISGTATNEVELLAGSVSLKVKRLAGVRSAAQVKTPTSVLGVRGTEFVVASFNGAVLVACKEGEVACFAYSASTGSKSTQSIPSVPGKIVEVMENGSMKSGDFPEGNFEENWDAVRDTWKNFYIELLVADPAAMLNAFAGNWSLYSTKLESGAAKLRANQTLKNWLKQGSTPSGSFGIWMKEKQAVVKDLISVRGDMMLAIITWYRIEELLPYIPESAMSRKLANGQTIGSFIAQYKKSSKTVSNAISLFRSAEKLYMLRNDGVSPFSDF